MVGFTAAELRFVLFSKGSKQASQLTQLPIHCVSGAYSVGGTLTPKLHLVLYLDLSDLVQGKCKFL